MAGSLGKTVKKRVRKGMKKAEKTFDKLTPDRGPGAAKVAGMAAVGVAGVAGIVAAIRHLRDGADGTTALHVRADGDQWIIAVEGADGALERFRTKEEAVSAAREAAAEAAPSELVIHRLDGSVMTSHSYQAS